VYQLSKKNNHTKTREFKKIFITGITGSVATYLLEFLKKKNFKVYGSYRDEKKVKFLKIKSKKRIFKLDLNNFSKVKKIINKVKPDLIFHLASNADVKASFDHPREIILNNNNSTLNLLETIRISKINPIILLSSTSEVYGNSHSGFLNENAPLSPNNPYAVSKTFQDILAQNYIKIYKLQIIITRMFTYLNARRANLFASSWARQILDIEDGKIKYLKHGNLESSRSIMSISDAVNAYWLAAKKGKIGSIYNIGDGRNIKLSKFLNILKSMSKKKINTKLDKKLLRKTDIKKQLPNSNKFKKDTGWKVVGSLEKKLKIFFDEIKKTNSK